MSEPSGNVGPGADRDQAGRFTRGNRAALLVGERSSAFWNACEGARRDIAAAVIADQGHSAEDAPRALWLAADGLAQAVLLRDAAFLRVVESGGPLTASGRTRRAYAVWEASSDRVVAHLRLIGLRRVPKPSPSIHEYIAAQQKETA